jgi:hypothetical protein
MSERNDDMPKVSRETASEKVAMEGLDVCIEHLDGGYSVCFESHTADADLADETCKADDAYYVPPGHTPVHHAGAEIVEFSPTDMLETTVAVVTENARAAGTGG